MTSRGPAGCKHPKKLQSERHRRVHVPAALTHRRFAGPAEAGSLAGGSPAEGNLAAAPGILLGMCFEVAARSSASQFHSCITTVGKSDLPGGSSLLDQAGGLFNKGRLASAWNTAYSTPSSAGILPSRRTAQSILHQYPGGADAAASMC